MYFGEREAVLRFAMANAEKVYNFCGEQLIKRCMREGGAW